MYACTRVYVKLASQETNGNSIQEIGQSAEFGQYFPFEANSLRQLCREGRWFDMKRLIVLPMTSSSIEKMTNYRTFLHSRKKSGTKLGKRGNTTFRIATPLFVD